MKFAFIIFKYFPFGGAQRDMMRIARESVKLGHEVDIYTLSWEGELPGNGIRTHVLEGKGWTNHKRYQYFIRQVQAEIASSHYDLIVGFNRMPGLDAYFAADPCYIERATSARGWLYRLLGRYRFFAACERAVFAPEAGCEILLLSLSEKAVFQRWYATPEERFHLLPPVISAERFALLNWEEARASVRAEFGFGERDRLLLLVGSGFRTKGLDRAIEALAALPQELRSTTRLLVVGQDNPQYFRKLAARLGVDANVHFLSGRNDIPRLMQAADLLIHPAYRENTGLVLLEAMAAGLPVLASDVCGYAVHVAESGAGELAVSPFDQAAFNKQVARMLASELPEWRTRGLRYAAEIMAANDGSAEASMLQDFARRKQVRAA
jgi:UDP-glucose:(heptosyl)LPS alpha-1,3-glucosyltransferase